jgi:membrane protein YdbS with pleckstrin-like domain
MAVEQDPRSYTFGVAGVRQDERAEYVRHHVQPGDALTLEPVTFEERSSVAVYHLNRRIGHVRESEIWDVLKPGYEYEAWAGNIEYDDDYKPVVFDIEVVVYGRGKRSLRMPNQTSGHISSNRAGRQSDVRSSYRASPVMFRAQPIAFIFSLLLIPVGVGLIILLVWWLQSITTHLEIDEETVRYETGVFSKDRRALNRQAIRTVRVTQSFINRIMDVGAIEIFTAGDDPEIRALSMHKPNEIREMLGK